MRRIPLLCLLFALTLVGPAPAAFPGENGRIVVTRDDRGATPPPSGPPGPFPTPTPAAAPSLDGLYSMDPMGGAQTRISDSGFELEPTYAPDGRTVAFISSGSVCLVAPGAFARRCLNLAPRMFIQNPAWSPDGSRFVFDAARMVDAAGYAGPDLYTVAVDGSGLRMIVDGHGADHAAWSPDNKAIAFSGWVSKDSRGQRDLFSVAPDGTGLRNLTNTPSVSETRPDWAPDGSRVVYQAETELRTMAADGTDDRYLGEGWGPVFSPDGTLVAASVETAGFSSRVVTIPAGGGPSTAITSDDRFSDSSVTWGRVPDPLPTPTPTPAATATAGPASPFVAPVDLGPLARSVARQVGRGGIARLLAGSTLSLAPPAPGLLSVRITRGETLLAQGTANGAGTLQLRLRRTRAARRVLRGRERATVAITVGFTGQGAAAVTAAVVRQLRG